MSPKDTISRLVSFSTQDFPYVRSIPPESWGIFLEQYLRSIALFAVLNGLETLAKILKWAHKPSGRNFGSILYYKGVFTYNKLFYAIKYFFISDQYYTNSKDETLLLKTN